MGQTLVKSLRVFTVSALLFAAPAHACPMCHSPAGEQVRAGIVGDGLAAGLLATLLPFALTAGVVAAVHFSGGHSRRRAGDGDGHR